MTEFYNKFSTFLKQKYGERVRKICLDAGFTCPNCSADGKEGCIYCRNDSFSRHENLEYNVAKQMSKGIEFARGRMNIKKYIAYFQASTNTFAPATTLKSYYEQALSFENVVGISISTRPDCLSLNVIRLINDLSKKTDVWIELGLQTSHNKSLDLINRGHTYEDFIKAVHQLQKLNVRICTHLMLGLPGEGRNEMMETAKRIADLNIHEVKLHPVLILKETKLEKLFQNNSFNSLTLQEYATVAVDFISKLPSDMVIQRLTAEAPKPMLVAPAWSMNKLAVLNAINKEFQIRGFYQGKNCSTLE
jgi:uncharacterized protein